MKQHFAPSLVLLVIIATATSNGSPVMMDNKEVEAEPYSVTFIPAIHRGECTPGEWWYPADTQCAMCRCVANRLSRCIPKPGCRVTVDTTTMRPTPAMDPTVMPGTNISSASNDTDNFIYFVPAIHRGNCKTGQVWYPNDTQCAMCRCITPRFSRCIPKPGCRPTLSPTSATAAMEMESTIMMDTTMEDSMGAMPDADGDTTMGTNATDATAGNGTLKIQNLSLRKDTVDKIRNQLQKTRELTGKAFYNGLTVLKGALSGLNNSDAVMANISSIIDPAFDQGSSVLAKADNILSQNPSVEMLASTIADSWAHIELIIFRSMLDIGTVLEAQALQVTPKVYRIFVRYGDKFRDALTPLFNLINPHLQIQ